MLRIIPVFLLAALNVAGQPSGRMFVGTNANYDNSVDALGVLSFPEASFQKIADIRVADLSVYRDLVYVVQSLPQEDNKEVLLYDAVSLQGSGSIAVSQARKVQRWGDAVFISSDLPPYLAEYDATADHALRFGYNADLVPQPPNDFLIADEFVWLLTDSTLIVLNPATRSHVASRRFADLEFVESFARAQYIFEAHGQIFVDYRYQTALPQQALIHVSRNTLNLSLSGLTLFNNFKRPVAAANRIYMGGRFTHFDLLQAEFVQRDEVNDQPIAYDEASGTLFAASTEPVGIRYYIEEEARQLVELPGVVGVAQYLPGDLVSVDQEADPSRPLRLHPNPATGHITIEGEFKKTELLIFDARGRLQLRRTVESPDNQTQLDLTGLAPGAYQLLLQDLAKPVSRSFVVLR